MKPHRRIYNSIKRLAKHGSVNYKRQPGKHRITWSLINLVGSFSRLQLASAALTYHTIFAIVPVMSLMIAIAKGLGYNEIFIQQIRNIFYGQEAVSDYLLKYADSYLNNTKVVMWLGIGIGLLLLLYSVFSIFQTVDATFNMLWNEKPRSFGKLIKTFAFILVMPFVVVLALSLWWSMSSLFHGGIIKELNVFIVSVSAYTAVLFAAYKLIPNTKVRAKYAALSAVVCGFIFAMLQLFSYTIISSFNYRNIYGDLASLMIFLLVIYFTWCICLAGSKWNYFMQKAAEQERENDYKGTSHVFHKFLCLLVLERIESVHPFSGRFDAGELADNAESVYGLPTHVTLDIIRYLCNKKVLICTGDMLHLGNRYSNCTIGRMLNELDRAGRNSDVITDLCSMQKNDGLRCLWDAINNNGGNVDGTFADIPVREILGIKEEATANKDEENV